MVSHQIETANKETEILKRNHREIQDLKNTITEIKNNSLEQLKTDLSRQKN